MHGVIVNSHLWRHQLTELSVVRRCVAVDLMAHGATEIDPTQDVSFDAQAQMLKEVLDVLGIDKVDLVANDSGTGIAQIFAANRPERLRSVTLTNGDVHDNWPPKDFSVFLDMVAAGGLAETLRGMADDKARFRGPDGLGGAYERPEAVTDETIDAYLAPYLSNQARLHDLERFILAFDNKQTLRVADKLKALNVPTLILWGTGDIFFGVEWSHWLAGTIPGTRRRVERPPLPAGRACREVNAAMLQFWSKAS